MVQHPRIHHGVVEIPVLHVRGGTSTGVVMSAGHLPAESELRDEALRLLMGVGPGAASTKQNAGLGRGYPTSNKAFLVTKADGDGADIESTLAQLAADKNEIDWRVSCGNLSAALPLYALDQGLVEPTDPETRLRIFNTNTGGRMQATVRTPGARLPVPADTQIAGVVGRFPGVELSWLEPSGQITGALLPTGRAVDRIEIPEWDDTVEVSCIDAAVPMIVVRAKDLDISELVQPQDLESDRELKARLRLIRRYAGLAMGLRHKDGRLLTAEEIETSETVPKICLIAPGDGEESHLEVRYFTPQSAHPSLAVSGGSCLAAACLIPDSIAQTVGVELPTLSSREAGYEIRLAHPQGTLAAKVRAQLRFGIVEIHSVGYTRSAQILVRGHVPLYGASDALVEAVRQLIPVRS